MRDVAAEKVTAVIGGFYDAAYGGCWAGALAGLAQLFHGSRGWLFSIKGLEIDGHTSVDDPGFHSDDGKAAMASDPLLHRVMAISEPLVARITEIEDFDAFRTRPLFNDWLRPRDCFHGLQAHLSAPRGHKLFVDISRGSRQDGFSDADKALLTIIGPHIRRAGGLSAMVAGPGRTRPILDDFTVAALVVDRSMRVLDLNPRAARLLDQYPAGVKVRRGVFHPGSAAHAARLRAMVAGGLPPIGGRTGGVMLVGDPEGGNDQRIVLSVAPFGSPDMFGFPGEARALIALRPVAGGEHEPVDDCLIDLFGLNPRQARLARALLAGHSLRQAAVERGISYASARTYLDHIFRKTGTRQQSELVALMKTIEAALVS